MDKSNSLALSGRADLIPETQNIVTLAKYLWESKMFPNSGGVAGIITTVEYGRELGIPPVAALLTMPVVKGKPTMEAKAMLAVAQKNAGVTWTIDVLTNDECTMTFKREGFTNVVARFTRQEAKDAGLLGKDNWQLYPQDMLFARCASRGVRRIAPDAVLGLYSTEEMRDVEAIDSAKKDLEGGTKVTRMKPLPDPEPAKEEPVKEAEVVEPDKEAEEAPPGEFRAPWEDEAPKTEAPPDVQFDGYINEIKYRLKKEGVDESLFKTFLVEQGPLMNRVFVGKIGTVIRFHLGNKEDVKYLANVIDRAIALYKAPKK